MDTDKNTKTLKEKFTFFTDKKNLFQMLKFLFFSIGAGIIQILSFTLMNELTSTPEWLSYFISLVLSIIFNFTFNRHFTFSSSSDIPIAIAKVATYYTFFTPASLFWTDALTNFGWNEYIVLGGTMIINFVTEFLYQRFFVFSPKYNKKKSITQTYVKDENLSRQINLNVCSKFSLLKTQKYLTPNKNLKYNKTQFHIN